jgi:ribosomal protein L32E
MPPGLRRRIQQPYFWRIESAQNARSKDNSKRKKPHRAILNYLNQLKFGEGEGIRTLDPNLGKVVILGSTDDLDSLASRRRAIAIA